MRLQYAYRTTWYLGQPFRSIGYCPASIQYSKLCVAHHVALILLRLVVCLYDNCARQARCPRHGSNVTVYLESRPCPSHRRSPARSRIWCRDTKDVRTRPALSTDYRSYIDFFRRCPSHAFNIDDRYIIRHKERHV